MILYYLLCSDPRRRSVLRSGLAPAGAVLRQTEHIGNLLGSLMCLLANQQELFYVRLSILVLC